MGEVNIYKLTKQEVDALRTLKDNPHATFCPLFDNGFCTNCVVRHITEDIDGVACWQVAHVILNLRKKYKRRKGK